jgi:hypothetical protein
MHKLKAKSLKRKVKTQNLKLLFLSFCFTLYALHFTLMAAFCQVISSTELINNAKQYDGKVVDYEGEVIGEMMLRGEYAWVNVYDGDNALGIWLSKDLTRGVLYTGSYKSKGDRVVITGIFHENCLEHGGDLDIHAQAVRKISPGRVATERINFAKVNQAAILGGACLLMLILTLFKRK